MDKCTKCGEPYVKNETPVRLDGTTNKKEALCNCGRVYEVSK